MAADEQWFYVTIDVAPTVANRSEKDAEREVGRPPDRQLSNLLMWRSTVREAPEWEARLKRLGYQVKTGTPTNGFPV